MQQVIQRIKYTDYLLMFLLLFFSGNPLAKAFDPYQFIILVLLEIVFFSKRITALGWRSAARWSALFLIIFLGQYFTLHIIGVLASVNYIIKMLTAIFAAYILKEKFSYTYLKVMSMLSLIALVLWGINLLGLRFPSVMTFENNYESLIIYTQVPKQSVLGSIGVLRNCGMFWEPGAFAGYIMVTFFFFINHLDYLWKKHRKEVIILILALVSTFSTTGFIIMSVTMIVFLNDRIKNKVIFAFLATLAIAGIIYAFNSLDFLGDKIQNEYENAIKMDQYDVSFNRMGALMFDLNYIKMHPMFGNGLLNETRFSQHISFAENLMAFGNGFSGEIAYFGIPFMLIFLFSIYKNPTLSKKKRWPLLVLFILQLQGEYFMNYPLFLVFPFVYFFNIKKDFPIISNV